MTNEERVLREHLVALLGDGDAHIGFDEAVADWPAELRGTKPPGTSHTAWQLLEHMRIAQWDILEFSRDAKHVSPEFPEGYWPKTEAPPSPDAWDKSIAAYRADHEAMMKLVNDVDTNLFARIPWGKGQTVLREAMVVAVHAAYHLGQLMMLRRIQGH